MTWENEYLDQHDRFRNLMIIEKGEKPPQQKRIQTKRNLFCATLPKKQSNNLKLLGKMKKILFHLIFPNHLGINEWFFVGVNPFFW